MSARYPDFVENYEKSARIVALLDDIAARREARAQQAELHKLQIEAHQQDQARKNFEVQMRLAQIGALPVHPGILGKFEAGLGGRGTIEAPTGGQYSLPSPSQQFQRATTEAVQQGTLKGLAARTQENIENPETAMFAPPGITPDLPMGGLRVRQKDKAAIIRSQIERGAQSQTRLEKNVNAETGDVTYDIIDKGGNLVKSIKREGIATKRPEKQISDAELRARATIKARARLAQEFSGPKLKEIEDSYAGGLYQTYAQEEGIDWRYEQDAKRDSDKARHVAQVRARAQRAAQDIVQRDLKAKEEQYVDEEVAGGGTTTVKAKGKRGRATLDDVKARARADVKAAGETPQAIKAFEDAFGEKYR